LHIHGNQFDPNIQLNALDAAAKAEAKQQAEETRKKLLSAASALAGEADCVVKLSGDGASEENNDGGGRRNQDSEKKQGEQADSVSGEEPFSDWA
jgi:hypothetical protein